MGWLLNKEAEQPRQLRSWNRMAVSALENGWWNLDTASPSLGPYLLLSDINGVLMGSL